MTKFKYEGPYVVHSLRMLQSAAWRALSRDHNAKRFIERLEIEHMLHAGKDNGRLPCTYNDLVDYGIHREVIARSIRRAVTYGFVEIAQRGRRSAAGGNPALYRLTYLPTFDRTWPTDDWKNYRPNWPPRGGQTPKKAATGSKNQNVGTETSTDVGTETRTVGSTETRTDEISNCRQSRSTEIGTTFYNSIHLVEDGSGGAGGGSGVEQTPLEEQDLRGMPKDLPLDISAACDMSAYLPSWSDSALARMPDSLAYLVRLAALKRS